MSKTNEIIEIIKKEKQKEKITNVDLAKQIGCTTQAIRNWLNGKRKISLENADKILKILGANMLIGKDNEK